MSDTATTGQAQTTGQAPPGITPTEQVPRPGQSAGVQLPNRPQQTQPRPIDRLPRANLLRDAEKTITGARNDTYGDARESFDRIAALWSVLLPVTRPLTGVDVAKAMAAMKLARLHVDDKQEDTWLDLAGYAALGFEIAQGAES